MVFSRMAPADKDAFFALLDEYFASRPDLFNGSGSGESGPGVNGAGPSSATGPGGRAQAAAASAVSSAFSQAANRSADANGWKRPNAAATAEIGNSVGRVAAAAAALKLNPGEQTPSGNGAFPRPPARRTNTSSSNEEPAVPPPEHKKLQPSRKFGDVDMSSGKSMFNSLRNSTAAKHATPAQVAPPTPPAFQRKNDFAPPPRRVPSTGSSRSSVISSPAPPIPRRTQEPEPEESGEWAEAMYDYHSEDPGDLDLQEGVRVLILEKTSDDWWTGEIDGQRGLVPAAYVKLL